MTNDTTESDVKRTDRGARKPTGETLRGLGGNLDLDLDKPAPTLTHDKKLSESKHGFEIGGSNSCQCDVPELELDKGSVGRWRFQIIWCEECEYHFGSALELQELEDGD